MVRKRTSDDRCVEFCPELLEDRRMLAGNVDVRFSAENLTLIGDAQANVIGVLSETGGGIRVIGFSGTTLTYQGVSASEHIIPTATSSTVKRLKINMKDGDDSVTVNGTRAERATINLGSGNDAYRSQGNQEFGQFTLNGGAGEDRLDFHTVDLGNANINMDEVIVFRASFDGKLTIRAGAGDNRISIVQSDAFGRTRIMSGSGTDIVGLSSSRFFGSVTVNAGSDNDIVQTLDSVFHEDVKINLGSGRDTLLYTTAPEFYSRVLVHGGTGNDKYEFTFGTPVFHGPDPIYKSIIAA